MKSPPLEEEQYSGTAVGYARVSTLAQEAGISLDAQEEAIREYCQTQGLRLLHIAKEVWSGTKLVRDKLDNEIMPLVKAKKITHIVCYDQDRWARNEYARLKWEKEVLEPHGVELLIVNEGHFGSSHDRDLVRGLKGNVAQHFAHLTRSKVIQAMNFKAKDSEYCGGNVPYGYQPVEVGRRTNNRGKVKVIRRYDPHPFESKVVLFIKQLYGLGSSDLFPLPERFKGLGSYGTTVITGILNALSFRKRNGKPFDTAFVKKLIHDERGYHVGTFSYRKTFGDKDERRRHGSTYRPEQDIIEIPQAFPAIVPAELQNICKKKIEDKGLRAKRSNRFTVQRTEYLGSGLFHCSLCGGIMVGRTRCPDHKHKNAELRYMCANRYNKAGCTAPMVKASYLHQGLHELVKMFLGRPENVEIIAKHTVEVLKSRQKQKPDSLASVHAQLQKVTIQKSNLIANLKEAPELGRVLRDELLSLDQEQARLRNILHQMEAESIKVSRESLDERVREACKSILKVWYDAPLGQKNQMLKALIRRAEVNSLTKEVQFTLAIPIDNLVNVRAAGLGRPANGGCTEVMAEVHGNRTHPPARHRCTGFEDQEAHQDPGTSIML